MTVWLWVVVGVMAFVALSTVVALAIASILAQIGRDVSELLEGELLATASAPLAREQAVEVEEDQKTSVERRSFVGSEASKH
jgi:hypothetical protein